MYSILQAAFQRIATLCFEAPYGEKNFNWYTYTYETPTPENHRDLIVVGVLAALLVAVGLWQYRVTRNKRQPKKRKR